MIIKDLMLSGRVTPTLWRDGVSYFNKSDALLLLEVCDSMDVGVLGIEGFIICRNSIQPQMDWIADFSEIYKSNSHSVFVKKTVKYSKEFLAMPTSRDDVVFEFVLKKEK